jgi:hypothetical protein
MDDEISPSTVTLSRSEEPVALGVEMHRCTQHDNAYLTADHRESKHRFHLSSQPSHL